MLVEIKHRFADQIIISGEYESVKDCLEKNRGASLAGADLAGAYLGGANLVGAYLRGAYLEGAYLGDIKGYVNSHDIFIEIIRRQGMSLFTKSEWEVIGQIVVHRPCWDDIESMFKHRTVTSIAKKLANIGYGEWLEKWKMIC